MIVASPTQISFPLLRARRLPRPGRGIGVHPQRLGALSSLLSSSNISTLKPSNLQTIFPPSPFPATLATLPQLTENTAALNPASVNLDAASSISPLPATLTKNTRGGGLPSFFKSIPRSNHAFTPNSHGITSFAHTHPLTTIESHSCKNRGEGAPSLAQASSSLSRVPPPSTFNFSTFNPQTLLLTTHYPLLTSYPLKPRLQMAHLYLCTCKKGPSAREPRYSSCAAS